MCSKLSAYHMPHIPNNIFREITKRREGQSQGVDSGQGEFHHVEDHLGDTLTCTRKFCGGLMQDIKRKGRVDNNKTLSANSEKFEFRNCFAKQ